MMKGIRFFFMGSLLLINFLLLPRVTASTIVATNLVPFEHRSSGYRTDIGYASNTNGGFQNTAHSQRFSPDQSGKLTKLKVLINRRAGNTPLYVAIRADSGGKPGTSFGEKAFGYSMFPTSYVSPGSATELDFSELGIMLNKNATYHAVFRTQTAIFGSWHYSSHIVRPEFGNLFDLPYLHSRDGGLTWNSGSSIGLEASLQVSAEIIPEPCTAALVFIGVTSWAALIIRFQSQTT